MLWQILCFPFALAGWILAGIFGFAGWMFHFVFGLLGGIFTFVLAFALLIAGIVLCASVFGSIVGIPLLVLGGMLALGGAKR